MRTLRLALLSAAGCSAIGCFDQNAVDAPKDQTTASATDVIQSVPGATAQALVQPYSDNQGNQAVIGFSRPLPLHQVPHNLIDMQRHTYTEFANTMDFGHMRMTPPPGHRLPYRYAAHGATLDFTEAYPPESPWHGYWKIDKVQLIGMVHDAAGTAYDTKDGEWHRITAQTKQPARNPQSSPSNTIPAQAIPVRELTEFERETLKDLRAGAQLLVKSEGDRLKVVGAVRAMNESCKSCHSVPEGHLMGAFTYELKRTNEKPALQEPKPVVEVLP